MIAFLLFLNVIVNFAVTSAFHTAADSWGMQKYALQRQILWSVISHRFIRSTINHVYTCKNERHLIYNKAKRSVKQVPSDVIIAIGYFSFEVNLINEVWMDMR